jgi:hypothetical protein
MMPRNFFNSQKLKVLNLFLLIAMVVSCGANCSSHATLRVTPEHRNFLNEIGSRSYSNNSINRLFMRLDEKGNKICDMIFQYAEYDEALAKEFSSTLDFHKKKNQMWYNNILPSLIAGCANFYKMNDRGVHNVFRILETLYPEDKDCFTVGFTQYYMMLQEMRCGRVVSADADWRILKAHYDFQELVRSKAPDADALSLLKSIPLHWVAHFDFIPQLEEEIGAHTFCTPTERKNCMRSFEHFISLPEIKRTELMLGFIHDSQFTPKDKNVSVIFMSNALDWEYTTIEQFDKLHASTREYLAVGQKIAIVYQAGDSEDIVVYELAKTDSDELNISIRCRDNIRWSDQYALDLRGKPFNTYFDDLLDRQSLKGVPRCHARGTKNYNDPKKSKKYIESQKNKNKKT